MHHADASGQGGGGISRRKRPAEHLDRAGIGNVVAEQDADERALPCTVLTQQSEHLAAREIERDVVVGYQRAKALGDAGETEDGWVQFVGRDRRLADVIPVKRSANRNPKALDSGVRRDDD